jgi:hypothetical protein
LYKQLIIFCGVNVNSGIIVSCRPFRAMFLLFVTRPVGAGYNPNAPVGAIGYSNNKIDSYTMLRFVTACHATDQL